MRNRLAGCLVGLSVVVGPLVAASPAFAADPTPSVAPETGGGATCSGSDTTNCGQEGSGGTTSGNSSGTGSSSTQTPSTTSTNSSANLPTTLPATGSSGGSQLAHTGPAQTSGFGLAGGVLVITGAGLISYGRRRQEQL